MGLEVRIASPCSANWNQMVGDDRVRFCPECRRNVYNFSSMTESEVKRLVAQSEGRVCGRFYQRGDGTMLAKNCPIGFRGSILRATRMATATLAAAVAATSFFARPAPAADRVIPSLLLQIQAAHPVISIAVIDPAGGEIPGAEVTFRNEKTEEKTTGTTDASGILRMTALAKGEYEVTVSSPGFMHQTIPHVNIPHRDVMKVALSLGLMGEVIEITPVSRVHRFFSRIFQSL
jgi:carboxypeptidase family protein